MRKALRGAAAVEFALVLPILIALILGMMEFGYLIFLNSAAAGAAREGARAAAISRVADDGKQSAESTFTNTTPRALVATATVTFGAHDPKGNCQPGASVIVRVDYSYSSLTRLFGDSFKASGIGEMRCGG